MPIYEYACEKCEHEFEVEQRITDEPVKTCPRCRGRKVKRLISQTSFVLKGGGWYSDLYSSKKGSTSDKGDGGGKTPTGGGSGGKDAGTKPSTSSDAGGKTSSGGGESGSGTSTPSKGSSGSKGGKGGSKAAA